MRTVRTQIPPQSAPEKQAGARGYERGQALKRRAAGVGSDRRRRSGAGGAAPPPPCSICCRAQAGIVALLRRDDGWSARTGRPSSTSGRHRRVRWRSAARGRGRAFACCVAEWLNRNPALAPGAVSAAVAAMRTIAAALGIEPPAMPGCIRAAGRLVRERRPRRRAGGDGDRAPAKFPDDFGKNGGA